MQTIAVCIPCAYKHVPLLNRCVNSIKAQTFQPDEIIISISGIPKTNPINIHYLYKNLCKKTNLIIIYNNDRKYAGENRNIAIEHSTSDIISFIDADDIMYPERLSIISQILNQYTNHIGVLHYFTENETLSPIEQKKPFNQDLVKSYYYTDLLHYGHPSFRRSIFDKYKYLLDPRTQDFKFIECVISEYLNNLLIYTAPLTCYYSNDSTFYSTTYRE